MRLPDVRYLASLLLLILSNSCNKSEELDVRCRDVNFTQNIADPGIVITPPNSISPNGDGLNESFILAAFYTNNSSNNMRPVFRIRTLKIFKFNTKNIVFESQNYQDDFSGYDSQGQQLPEGIYAYEATLDNNSATGSLTIVRTTKSCNCRALNIGDIYLDDRCQ